MDNGTDTCNPGNAREAHKDLQPGRAAGNRQDSRQFGQRPIPNTDNRGPAAGLRLEQLRGRNLCRDAVRRPAALLFGNHNPKRQIKMDKEKTNALDEIIERHRREIKNANLFLRIYTLFVALLILLPLLFIFLKHI